MPTISREQNPNRRPTIEAIVPMWVAGPLRLTSAECTPSCNVQSASGVFLGPYFCSTCFSRALGVYGPGPLWLCSECRKGVRSNSRNRVLARNLANGGVGRGGNVREHAEKRKGAFAG